MARSSCALFANWFHYQTHERPPRSRAKFANSTEFLLHCSHFYSNEIKQLFTKLSNFLFVRSPFFVCFLETGCFQRGGYVQPVGTLCGNVEMSRRHRRPAHISPRAGPTEIPRYRVAPVDAAGIALIVLFSPAPVFPGEILRRI